MTRDVAEQIAMSAQGMNLDIEILEDYSGRGMMGETTAALVLGCPLMAFVAAVAQAALDAISPKEIIRDIRKARVDSLGRDTVIY